MQKSYFILIILLLVFGITCSKKENAIDIDKVDNNGLGYVENNENVEDDENDAAATDFKRKVDRNGFEYIVKNDGITITGYQGNKKSVVIPGKINGLPVIAIGEDAFKRKELTNVTIPNSVKTIGRIAFWGTKLTHVIIPDSVETIEYGAFGYNELTSIVIPDFVKKIDKRAFTNNKLTKIVIPDSVETIGRYAFGDNQLTVVIIHNSVKAIDDGVFYNNRLQGAKEQFSIMIYKNEITITGYNNYEENIVIPEKINGLPVVAIGGGAFKESNLSSAVIPNSVKTIGEGAFSKNQLTNIVIPNSVETIDDYAFNKNILTDIIIPNSVKTIGKYAFADNQLTNVIIPNSVKTIDYNAFHKNKQEGIKNRFSIMEYKKEITIIGYNHNKKNVIIPAKMKKGLPVVAIANGAFHNKGLTRIVIPNSVKSIGEVETTDYGPSANNIYFKLTDGAFANNKLTNITIPHSVKIIGDYAFEGNQLTNVIVPNSVETIGDGAFDDNELTHLTIPISVKTIGRYAFANNKLTNVIIPNSVKTIGRYAFECNELTNVIIPNSVEIIDIYAFGKNRQSEAKEPFSIIVYKNKITITGYNHNEKNIVIPEKINGLPVVAISDNAFSLYPPSYKGFKYSLHFKGPLNSVVIPDSIKKIGKHAFYDNCLTNVVIPNSVKTIDDGAFEGNYLTNVVIPSSVKKIGRYAFYNNRLEGAKEQFSIMVYENEVTIIGYNHDKKNVVIPREINGLPVVAIDSGAFQVQSSSRFPNTMNLNSVVVPKSVKIEKYTFDSDTKIIRKWKK